MLFILQTGVTQTISLNEFLDAVQQTHPFFEKESLTVDIAIESQKRYLGDKNWIIESSPFLSYDDKSDIINSTYNKSKQIQLNGSLQKKFWKTGGQFKASYLSSYIDQENRTAFSGVPFKLFKQQLMFSYSHPLLKNKRGILDRLEYELASYTIDFSNIQSLENQENFLLNVGLSFLDWVFLEEQLKINKERLVLAEEELETAKEKFAARLVDKVDVLRQEDAHRIALQNVVLSQTQYHARQTELAVLVPSSNISNSEPLYDLYSIVNIEDAEQAINKLESNSRIVKSLGLLENQLRLKKDGFVNQGKAQLDLNLSSTLIEDDESYGKSLGIDNPSFTIGLNFKYPLGSKTSKADVKKTEKEILQLHSEKQNILLDLASSIKSLAIQIKEMEKILELNKSQIESATERTSEELIVYRQGRGDMTFVIQSQDNEANARLTYLNNSVNYHKLVLQYKSILDQLLKSV